MVLIATRFRGDFGTVRRCGDGEEDEDNDIGDIDDSVEDDIGDMDDNGDDDDRGGNEEIVESDVDIVGADDDDDMLIGDTSSDITIGEVSRTGFFCVFFVFLGLLELLGLLGLDFFNSLVIKHISTQCLRFLTNPYFS